MGHFAAIGTGKRVLRLAAALGCVALLGGCGGVEFEGKIFDYAGISGTGPEPDPTMTERAPLMVPPNVASLPAPTQSRSVAASRPDWPDDPEKVRTRVIEEKKTATAEAEAEADPMNPYAGKETLLDKLLSRDKTVEEPIPDVPEPDASDRAPTSVATQSGPQAPHVPQAPLPDRNQEGFNPSAPENYRNVSGGQNRNVAF